MTEKTQVLDMVRAGTISPAEGQRLIDALEAAGSRWRVLVDPFPRLSTATGWLLAIVVVAACVGVSRLGFRFDGALDIHMTRLAPPWRTILIDAANALVVTAILFWLASVVVSRRGRLVDFLVAVSVARVPLVAVGLLTYWLSPPVQEVMAQVRSGTVSTRVMLATLPAVPLFFWFLILLYHGFAHASGLRGGKAIAVFAVVVTLAELCSKLVLFAVFTP